MIVQTISHHDLRYIAYEEKHKNTPRERHSSFERQHATSYPNRQL